MNPLKNMVESRPMASGAVLWLLSVALMLACIVFQDRTGPTQPLEGSFDTDLGPVGFRFLRSQDIGKDLPVMLLDPVPAGLTGHVRFRRYMSHDDWKTAPLSPMETEWSRRGSRGFMKGMGANLPSLMERAGKYEFFVHAGPAGGSLVSITGDRAVIARYKSPVPALILLAHIVAIFASMTFAIRITLEAVVDGKSRWPLFATPASLLAGAFVLGPLVQMYAFGVWWSGVPFGWDWTDNKVLVALAAWMPALALNVKGRRNRVSVIVAGLVTVAVYFVPHSIFGSQYDYRTGRGHGTAGAVEGPAGGQAKAPAGSGGAMTATAAGGPVFDKDVLAGIHPGLDAQSAKRARAARISLLDEIAADRRFLESRGIEAPVRLVERRLSEMRLSPPISDCGCCPYKTLDDYMRANFMTGDDLRAQVANEIGMDIHCEKEWAGAYPTPQSRAALLAQNRERHAKEASSDEEMLSLLKEEFQRRTRLTVLRSIRPAGSR